jgi:hypothetical protein
MGIEKSQLLEKLFYASCRCGNLYLPHPESYAKCNECNEKEDKKLLENFQDQNFFVFRNRRQYSLNEDKVKEIREYFCENYGIKFKQRHQASKFIRKDLGIEIGNKLIESITHVVALRKVGMNYKYRPFRNDPRGSKKA